MQNCAKEISWNSTSNTLGLESTYLFANITVTKLRISEL